MTVTPDLKGKPDGLKNIPFIVVKKRCYVTRKLLLNLDQNVSLHRESEIRQWLCECSLSASPQRIPFVSSAAIQSLQLYFLFWAIPRPLNFMCRRFGTPCSF